MPPPTSDWLSSFWPSCSSYLPTKGNPELQLWGTLTLISFSCIVPPCQVLSSIVPPCQWKIVEVQRSVGIQVTAAEHVPRAASSRDQSEEEQFDRS